MGSIRKTVVEILEANNGEVSLLALDRELKKRRALGFGVDTTYVVGTMMREGKVRYDKETEVVYLIPPDIGSGI